MVRALARKARGPGFDPQLRCLNFSFLRRSVSAFFLRLVCWNGLIDDVFSQSGSGLSYAQLCYGTVRAWPVPRSPTVDFMHMLDIVLSDNRMHVASQSASLPRLARR